MGSRNENGCPSNTGRWSVGHKQHARPTRLAESNPATVRIIVVDDDPIKSSVSMTLPNSALDLVLTGKADIDGVGNGWDNRIIGNKGNNVLDGKAGNDRLEGKEGKDLMIGGTGNDTLKGGDGKDTYLFTRNDIQAGGVDKAYDSKGDALDLTALLSDIRIDGVGLDAITKNFVLGDSLSRAAGHETSLAFIDGKLLFDLDRDGRFSPDSDFQPCRSGNSFIVARHLTVR